MTHRKPLLIIENQLKPGVYYAFVRRENATWTRAMNLSTGKVEILRSTRQASLSGLQFAALMFSFINKFAQQEECKALATECFCAYVNVINNGGL